VTASPWRTPRCGVPTAESSQSLDRPASPARRRCNAPNDPAVVGDKLGHADPNFTIKRYIGVRRNADVAAMIITEHW
jgi:hypothetical protein